MLVGVADLSMSL